MNTEKSPWISSYIFYDPEQIDFLLLEGIYPFIMDLENNFFFIRYRENGPHIRLRIKAKDDEDKVTIIRNLTSYFDDWFNKFPSEREEPEYVKKGKYYWYPNNSIHCVEYVPETERYGGQFGIFVAEEQFEYSSKIVLELLSQSINLNYKKKLALSLILNLYFVVGLGLSKNEAAAFFRILFNLWLPLSFRTKDPQKLNKKSYRDFKEKTLTLFEHKFESQKSIIIPKAKDPWYSFNDSDETSNHPLKNWMQNSTIIKKKFNELYTKGKLTIPEIYQPVLSRFENIKGLEGSNIDLWVIYESLVHMMNNRLGLVIRDEPYINYMLSKSIEIL